MSTVGWRLRTTSLSAGDRTLVVAILNVTPDSFSDGDDDVLDPRVAIERGIAMWEQGADVIDVGGESTRPYAGPVGAETETRRVIPVIEGLASRGVVVSIDTMKPGVAAAAIASGAEIINDVSGFRDDVMTEVAVRFGVGVVVMHMQGTPLTMQDDPRYDDVVAEVASYLAERTAGLVEQGVDPGKVVVDPGIGFGKTFDDNLRLLDGIGELAKLGYPVMVGASRKGFLGTILDGIGRPAAAGERDLASAVVAGLAVVRGAGLVRAHNVAAALESVAVADAMVRAASQGNVPSQRER